MSELPPAPPDFPYEMDYETDRPGGNAPLLIKLAGIFQLVIAGMDVLYGLVCIGASIFFYFWGEQFFAAPGMGGPPVPGAGGGPGAGPPLPTWAMALLYVGYAALGLGVGTVKIIAGVKLLRFRRNAWGWSLAAGIVGCTQIWCSICCVLPLGVGIYTIVILCQQHVQVYLRQKIEATAAAAAAAGDPLNGNAGT